MSKARDLADFVSANSTLDNLETTYVDTSGDTMTGVLTLSGDPTTNLQAATKQYVDTIAAAGIHYHNPVRVESPISLNATYDNGSSGVGATLTNSSTLAAITIDGVALSLNDRVLVYEQTDATQNGIYTVTTVGDGSTAWVLTRATDANTYGTSDSNALGEGDAFFVKEGDTGAGELYVMNTTGSITFGTTNITFTVIAETAVYSAGTGLTLDGTTFNTAQDIATTASPTFAGLTVDTNTLYVDSANNKVGIGTTTAFSDLSISVNSSAPSTTGNMSSDGLTIHNGSGGRALQIGVNETGAYSYLQSCYVNNAQVANDLAIFTGTTERMRIDSSGAVTINSGNITLGGTGRIQGVDTVSSDTDAANKAYVDTAVAGVGGGPAFSSF